MPNSSDSLLAILRQHWGWLSAAFVLALIFRIGMILHFGSFAPPKAGSDAWEFDTYAWNLVSGNGYRGPSPAHPDGNHLTSHRVPGYTIVLAATYGILGHRFDAPLFVNALLGALTTIEVFLVGALVFGVWAGRVASAGYAVWPISGFYATTVGAEVLFAFILLALVIACLTIDVKRLRTLHMTTIGVLVGSAMLTRAESALMLASLGLWALVIFGRDWRRTLRFTWVFLIAALVLTPWTVRNYRVHGVFMPLSSIGGQTFLGSNNRVVLEDPRYHGYWVFEGAIPEYREALAGLGEAERDREALRLGLEFLAENRDSWPFLVWQKIKRFWSPVIKTDNQLMKFVMLATWGPVFVALIPSFLVTFLRFLRSRRQALILHFTIGYTLPHVILINGQTRMRFGIEAICIVLATWGFLNGIAALHRWWRNRRGSGKPTVVQQDIARDTGDVVPSRLLSRSED